MSGIFKRCTTTSGITTRRARSCCSTSRSTDPSAYAESKLCDVLLAFAVARRWKDVKSNALEPGWVATKMGGPLGAGRSSSGVHDPGLACYERRRVGAIDPWVFLSSTPSCAEPDCERRQDPGGATRG